MRAANHGPVHAAWRALGHAGLVLLTALALQPCAVIAGPDAALLAAAERERSALLRTLDALVRIDSSSHDPQGVRAVAEHAAVQLRALGGEVQVITPTVVEPLRGTPKVLGPSVQAVFRGRGRGRVLLLAHLDTAYAPGAWERLGDGTLGLRIEGDDAQGLAWGLGAADCKQGVALAIHTVALLRQLGDAHFGTVTLLLSGDEEISSPGSRHLIAQLASEQDAVYSLEGSGPDGALWLATSGVGAAYLTVHGRPAHAGLQPGLGINALEELAHQLLNLRDLSEPAQGLRLTWTVAEASLFRNVVPGRASAQADVRALRMADFDRLRARMAERLRHKLLPDSHIDLSFELRRPPLVPTEASRALARRAQAIYRDELGLPLTAHETPMGGGTDAAFAGQHTRAGVLEGLGLTGHGAHTGREAIELRSIVPRLYLLVRLIQSAAATATPAAD